MTIGHLFAAIDIRLLYADASLDKSTAVQFNPVTALSRPYNFEYTKVLLVDAAANTSPQVLRARLLRQVFTMGQHADKRTKTM